MRTLWRGAERAYGRVQHRANRVDVRAQKEQLTDLSHDLCTQAVRGPQVAEHVRYGPLCGMPILPVSLIISGMSLVSSIVDEISSSNYMHIRRARVGLTTEARIRDVRARS